MLTHLECSLTGQHYPPDQLHNLSEAGRTLLARYDVKAGVWDKASLIGREPTIWRYREMLPDCEPISLGEGMTPLHLCSQLGEGIWIKDEAVNPTGSFKARGMAVAISMAKKFGVTDCAVPSAGNAGGALAAYCAKAGIRAHIYMPQDTPRACIIEAQNHGAEVVLIDGLITDCGAKIAEVKADRGWFDVSTLKEPYRLEGKKTMGYELAEQLDWKLPDVIIYPTGGGTGLIGMWKAFEEMEQLGWIGPERPKMVVVQAEGCQPMVRAYNSGEEFAAEHLNAATIASGLRVPKAVGDHLILQAVRESNGTVVAVSDSRMVAAAKEISRLTGIFASPEGGATFAAYQELTTQGWLEPGEKTVLFNTGSGVKYLEALA
ncbi:threonine synthase [Kamptonema cortianum]|nr:threonine synthase [Geitlerinema splendidum]MDK3157664.1 threonine synthase [Kamptonema cortianum]